MGLKLNGTTGALVHSAKLVSSYPFSIGAWIAVDSNGLDIFAVSHGQTNADRDASIFLDANNVSKYARYRNIGSGSNAVVALADTSAYVFAVAVFESATSRRLYYGSNVPGTDASNQADNTTSHNQFVVGANFNNGASGLFLNGGIAEVHVWGVAINATQYENMRTDAIKPETITGYVDGWTLQNYSAGGTYTSIGGTRTMTAQGGVIAEPSRAHPISRTTPDTTAPVLSSPTGAATGNTTASASVSTDEGAGTIWCLTNTAATATASAVKAGTSQAVTATGVQTFASRTGLTADTLYYNHFVQDDAAGTPNTSAVANSASFRTTGAVTFSGPVPTRNGVVSTAASFANASFFASAFTLTYTLQAGTLPAGLTLGASTGIISGTPTTAGTSSGIVIRATDTNSNPADTNAYSIVIAATNASPTFPGSISNISGTAGSAITPVNVSGQFSDTDALAYTASPAGTAWPSALVVNSSTGIISGTVAGSGTTTGLKVRATDTASQTVDSNAFNAVIAAAPANPTVTLPAPLCHAMGGLPLVSVPGKFQFLSKTDLAAAPLANVSKTTDATGNVAPWAQAGLTSGVLVTLRWISDADGHEGYYDVIPA